MSSVELRSGSGFDAAAAGESPFRNWHIDSETSKVESEQSEFKQNGLVTSDKMVLAWLGFAESSLSCFGLRGTWNTV